jgi:hypothetical protein
LDVNKAEVIIEKMQDWPADACSGRWYDQNEKIILAVFADHIKSVSGNINSI